MAVYGRYWGEKKWGYTWNKVVKTTINWLVVWNFIFNIWDNPSH
jgi:hypothetical protein